MKDSAEFRKGSITIEICGEQIGRFLNLCKARQINLYSLEIERHTLKGCMKPEDFFKLAPIRRKTKVKIHILEKHGLPFFFYRCKRRKAFFLGIVLSVVILLFLSGRLWNIEIQGNVKYSTEEILDFLYTEGVVHGMTGKSVDCSEIASAVRKEFSDITWVSAKLEGTKLLVTIKEGIFAVQDEDTKETTCDIVSDSAGVIVQMVTKSGISQKKVGEECKVGDLLVSGVLGLTNDDQEIVRYEGVHADADIYIKRNKAYYREIPLTYEKMVFTGKKKTGIFIKLNNFYLGMNDKISENWEKVTEENPLYLTESFCLPISFGKISLREYEIEEQNYTEKEILVIAQQELEQYEEKLIQKGVQISANNVKIEVNHKTCISRGFLEIIEKIGKETPVEIPELPEERITENG